MAEATTVTLITGPNRGKSLYLYSSYRSTQLTGNSY